MLELVSRNPVTQDSVDLDVQEGNQVGQVFLELGHIANEISFLLKTKQVLELIHLIPQFHQEMGYLPVLAVDVDQLLARQFVQVRIGRQ